uniref:Leucine rich immune protein (Coil-less) n=1 Tax=Anopheles farauti TaxID=69004 RepID=A0A182QSE4_9DIPT
MFSLWFFGVTLAFGVGLCEAKSSSPPALLYHYEYSRIQETDQAWKCWQEGYRPSKVTSSKVHETGNGTTADIERLLRFDQSTAVLFLFTSSSDNGNLRTDFTIQSNRLVRLSLDNVGLERLQLTFAGRENDCRLADLSVPRNRLTEVPAGIERLTSLRKLDFSYNHLKQFDLDRLANAVGLKQLLLGHNRLESFVTPARINLDSLHTLDLSNNRLRTLDSTHWSMPKLETFHVDHNRHLATIGGWSKGRFPLVKGFDPAGTNNWNQTWLKSVQ